MWLAWAAMEMHEKASNQSRLRLKSSVAFQETAGYPRGGIPLLQRDGFLCGVGLATTP